MHGTYTGSSKVGGRGHRVDRVSGCSQGHVHDHTYYGTQGHQRSVGVVIE